MDGPHGVAGLRGIANIKGVTKSPEMAVHINACRNPIRSPIMPIPTDARDKQMKFIAMKKPFPTER